MRKLGAVAQGETPSAEEIADGLSTLNQMLSTWSLDGLKIRARVREEFTLTPGVATYTIGDGADLDTAKPIKIVAAGIEDTAAAIPVESPIRLMTVEQWAELPAKDTQSDRPSMLYAEGTHPNETLNLYPVPSIANKLVLYSEKAFTRFTSANTSVDFSEGYEEAIVYNLAVRLAPEYNRPVSAEIAMIANSSLEAVERANSREHLMSAIEGLPVGGRAFNIITGS